MIWPKKHLNFEALKKKRLEKIGQKFGKFTIESEGIQKKGLYTFNCICECGQRKQNIRYGDLKSLKSVCLSCREKNKVEDFYSNDRVKQRILESIKICENGCWEWQKRLNHFGYGQIKYRQTTHVAHRISYKVFKQEIPKGFCACHICDNRKCVNPDHLWIGSHKDNAKDRADKKRNNHYKKRRVGVDEVIKIRKLYEEKNLEELALQFGVTSKCIRDIVTRRTWK